MDRSDRSNRNLASLFPIFRNTRVGINPYDEIEAERRRKGAPPQGRPDAPTRPSGGGTSSGGSGGGWLPTSSSSGGGGGFRLPVWLVIVLVIAAAIFGGKDLLSSLLGGYTDTSSYEDQTTYPEYSTSSEEQSVPVAGFTPPASAKSGSWTVMLYQDADDQVLEQDVFVDFNEAERVGSTDQVHIVAQLDRYRGAFTGDGNWTTTRRYYVTRDDDLDAINSQLVGDLGEADMADPATLVDFATWAMQTFPADHYVLIMSDHGMGWPGGWVDPSPAVYPSEQAPISKMVGNAMYLEMVDSALGQIRQATGVDKLDIVGLDACVMGQLEVLSALEPHARYAIASEEVEPSLGWAYTAFLQALVQNPGMSAEDLTKLVVQSYISEDQRITDSQARNEFLSQMGSGYLSANDLVWQMGKDSTIAAIDLSKIPALNSSLNDLVYAMQSADQSTIAGARSYALSFTSIFGNSVPPSYIDLGNFVQILAQESGNATLQQLSSRVLTNIQQAVVAEKHGNSKKGATGISIYFPNSRLFTNSYSGLQSYSPIAARFTQNSLWDDFLTFHYTGRNFNSSSREAVIPSSSLPTRAPGLGQIQIANLRLSAQTAAPGQPVTMRADISGSNIGYIYLFVGFYDQDSNAIFVADTDYLESPNTQQVDGVYYPQWGTSGAFTLKFDWDPYIFTISDSQTSDVVVFEPQQYGASASDAVYSVDGIYTFASSGESLNARINFSNEKMVNIIGITGDGDTGAPHQITPQVGDTFTAFEQWLELDSQGAVQNTAAEQSSTTLTYHGQPFTWETTYAPQGDYILGFIVTDLDGNSQEAFTQVAVQ
jgi:hypothetical protein